MENLPSIKQNQYRYLWLLAGQLLFFISVAKFDSYDIRYSKAFFAVSTSVILVLGLLTITNKYLRRYGLIITSIVVALSVFGLYREHSLLYLAIFILYFIVILILTASIASKLLTTKHINYTHIAGSLAGFLMIAITLAMFLRMLAMFSSDVMNVPMAELGIHGLVYFSLISIATIGYGDVTPIMPEAQMFTGLIGVVSQFYMAVVVAIIIGKMMYAKENEEDLL